MLYDLEDPMQFMREVHEVLADDGLWVFEQSYMPTMLARNSYDTVCHEHIEYYALRQIKWMADRVGFVVVDVAFNDVNGGSFSVTVRKAGAGTRQSPIVDRVIRRRGRPGSRYRKTVSGFCTPRRGIEARAATFIADLKSRGETLYALGRFDERQRPVAVLCLTATDVPLIGEVNSEKWGRFTPGSNIPILSEDELLAMRPKYLMILPWHFKDHFVSSDKFKGKSLVFPLPEIAVVDVP